MSDKELLDSAEKELSDKEDLKQSDSESMESGSTSPDSLSSEQEKPSESTEEKNIVLRDQNSSDADVQFTVNTSKDTYRVIRELGEGAFATVYRAIRQSDNEHVAIKCLHYLNIEQFIIDDEVKVIKHLIGKSHQNIVRFYEIEETRKTAYIISEMAPIGDLFEAMQILNQNGNKIWKQLDENESRHLIKGIACGLQHLHNLGIAHGDLKLNNILLFRSIDPRVSTDTNFTKLNFTRIDRWKPKLTDFGNCETNLNNPKAIIWHDSPLCTPSYAAPETYENRKYDCKIADMFSLGCCLISMILGAQPFKLDWDLPQSHNNHNIDVNSVKTVGYNNKLKYDTEYKQQIFKIFSFPLRDLFTQILDSNPDNRISLDQFFNHIWITSPKSTEFEDEVERVSTLKSASFFDNVHYTVYSNESVF